MVLVLLRLLFSSVLEATVHVVDRRGVGDSKYMLSCKSGCSYCLPSITITCTISVVHRKTGIDVLEMSTNDIVALSTCTVCSNVRVTGSLLYHRQFCIT